jgi:hypothetical protein
MTNTEIETLFNQVIEEKAIYNELTGISEDKIYNWRKGRGAKPTIGDMLNVLYQLKKVVIKKAASGEVDIINKMEESWKQWSSKYNEEHGVTAELSRTFWTDLLKTSPKIESFVDEIIIRKLGK